MYEHSYLGATGDGRVSRESSSINILVGGMGSQGQQNSNLTPRVSRIRAGVGGSSRLRGVRPDYAVAAASRTASLPAPAARG
jgi:hypothetical protein